MGFASGSTIAEKIIKGVKKDVPDPKLRRKVCKHLINALEDADCDTLYQCEGTDPAFDAQFKAIRKKRGDYDEEEAE